MPPGPDDASGRPEPADARRSDFTHRVREERAGRHGLIANIPGMVYQARMEPTWPMEFVSAGARELTGHAPEDFLVAGPRTFGDLIHEEDRRRVWNDVDEAVAADRAFSVEYRIRHADGGIRHVWDHGHPVFDEDGRILCVEGIILDVTERVALAEQLRHAQRRETVGRLSGVVAHDFNNYLTGIIGSLELALTDLPPEAPARPSVELALQAGRKARDLTRQLLLVSRSRPQKREVVELGERVEGLLSFLAQVVGSPVELTLERSGSPLRVHVDPVLVDQVLLNLVVNAREALGGYGRVTIRTEARGEGAAALVVEDDGPGMDAATLERVFEPFFTTKDTGTGLGLATVKAIVAEAGGEVRVESAPGEGCRCHVVLPLAHPGERTESGPRREKGSGPRRGGGERILVVDDDPTVLRLVTTVLERFGYAPEGASDPEACRVRLEAQGTPPELAVVDVTLPGRSGIELVEELRAEGRLGRVLFMSGYAPEELVSGADSLRDTAYLEKPFSVEELLEAVARELASTGQGGRTGSEAG